MMTMMSPGSLILHHVGVVLPDRDAVVRYCKDLNLPILAEEYVAAFCCHCIFVGPALPCVELIIPNGGRLAEFNNGQGGLHHFAYRTESLRAFMGSFENGKARWLHPAPVRGARGMWVNFLAPSHLGLLTEFVEESSDQSD